jgi:hypothetical protein
MRIAQGLAQVLAINDLTLILYKLRMAVLYSGCLGCQPFPSVLIIRMLQLPSPPPLPPS